MEDAISERYKLIIKVLRKDVSVEEKVENVSYGVVDMATIAFEVSRGLQKYLRGLAIR